MNVTDRKIIKAALTELDGSLQAMGGCGDGDCKVYKRGGMHTNGGCRCLKNAMVAERVNYYRRRFSDKMAELVKITEDAE